MAEYGFDLTDFGSPVRFKKVLRENKLPLKGRKKCKVFKDVFGKRGSYCHYEWGNKNVKLITGNNPITGKHGLVRGRQTEKGYASYIGIEGKPLAVRRLAKSIKRYAIYIKGENPKEREFI